MRSRRAPIQRISLPSPRAFALTAALLALSTAGASPALAGQDEAPAEEQPPTAATTQTSEPAAAMTETAATETAAAEPEAPPADPCAAPEHHQFDFWLGDWEVRDADGKPQGTNLVDSLYGSCVLQEHWKGEGGSIGTSFNLYDTPRGVWHQTWVDGHGGLLVLEGGLEGKEMVLRGYRPSREDHSVQVLHEIRWTPLDDGRVRQHWRASKDEGKTWVTVFDGYYAKVSN